MKVLFAASEIYPYVKTGGLADVSQSLPTELSSQVEITSIVPLYEFIDREQYGIVPAGETFQVILGSKSYDITLYQSINEGVNTLFVYEPTLCNRPAPYGDKGGDYANNDLRFGLFAKTIVVLAEMMDVDVLHLNDWHTALAALWAKEMLLKTRVIFTIHNLAFQGIFPKKSLQRLGIEEYYFTPESIEYWGQINCMKAGITYSDVVTTVSPSYAEEILYPKNGCGLEGFLQVHSYKLYGILNGIDTDIFDPEHDPSLVCPYSISKITNKQLNKMHFCEESQLSNAYKPLVVFIGRFTQQKGMDTLIQALPRILKMKINMAIIGSGEEIMEDQLRQIASNHDNLSLYVGFDEAYSHRMYAAADFLLMPSTFEPCGLNQFIAIRYGTVPIVHPVGGLADSIKDMNNHESSICPKGILLTSVTKTAIHKALKEACDLYADQKLFKSIIHHNMKCDVSFTQSAKRYLALYFDRVVDEVIS